MNDKGAQTSSDSCKHTLRIDSLCALCGADVAKNGELVPALHRTDRMFHTQDDAMKMQKKRNKKLDIKKKLILILDLDQTVLHTSLTQMNCDFEFKLSTWIFYVKLRPHLKSFLQKVSRLFEIHVYTMGTREYASSICAILDPQGKYFGDRIVSRSENFNELKKSIDRITCIKKNVVILDDRADVWDYCENLVLIKPFWFNDKLDINDPTANPIYSTLSNPLASTAQNSTLEAESKPSIMPVDSIAQTCLTNQNEASKDKELVRAFKILKKIHKKYFQKKKSISKALALKFMKDFKVASSIENFTIILFSGATIDLENPAFVIGDEELAKQYKVKNINIAWIYECIYKRKAVPITSYILSDHTASDEYQMFLETEFFG